MEFCVSKVRKELNSMIFIVTFDTTNFNIPQLCMYVSCRQNLVPLKLSSSVELIINLSAQSLLPFLVPPLFSPGLRSVKAKGG